VSIANRLARLEEVAAAQGPTAESFDERATQEREARDAAWALMQQTMSPEHARLVVDAYAVGAQYVQSAEFNAPAGRLLRRCLDSIDRLKYRHWPDTEIADEVILAMPPEVAEVYLTEDALPLHSCADCGFRVPLTPGANRRPARRHFDSCPLCGGKVGYYAYYNRRKAEADAFISDTIR
jgi:hypothetical protein